MGGRSRFVWIVTAIVVMDAPDALAESGFLEKAVDARNLSDWDEAKRLAEIALAGDELTDRERALAHQLIAEHHVAYGDQDRAREQYLRLLELDPEWRPSADASPKIISAFSAATEVFEARHTAPDDAVAPVSSDEDTAQVAATEVTPAEAAPDPVSVVQPAPSAPPWYQSRWVWVAAGTAVLLAGGVAYAIVSRPADLPPSDYRVRLPK